MLGELAMPKKLPKEFENLPPLLDTSTIAELLQVSRAGVVEMLKRGDLNGFQLGRNWRMHREDFLKSLGFDEALINKTYDRRID